MLETEKCRKNIYKVLRKYFLLKPPDPEFPFITFTPPAVVTVIVWEIQDPVLVQDKERRQNLAGLKRQ